MEFLWVGNHPGVDLCNTRPVIDGQGLELLADPSDLARWLDQTAVVGARLGPAQPDRATLRWAHQLRDRLRAVLTAADRIAPIDELNDTLARLSCSPRLDAETGLILSAANPQTQIRLALAATAIRACELPPERVRQCANRNCVLLFHDTTKNGTRRWHDMATCGNRQKAASHYRRRKRRD